MDFVGYAALGGLERVTIVAGAIIIGYWGYRLYAGEKKAGLVFMGLAVLVLVGALATGSSHLRSVGEGLQLASATPPEPALPAAEPAESAAPAAAEAPSPFSQPDSTAAEAAATETERAPEAADAETSPESPAAVVAATATPPESPVRLATGQELGGRIVSVKSENVSLEWSTDSD